MEKIRDVKLLSTDIIIIITKNILYPLKQLLIKGTIKNTDMDYLKSFCRISLYFFTLLLLYSRKSTKPTEVIQHLGNGMAINLDLKDSGSSSMDQEPLTTLHSMTSDRVQRLWKPLHPLVHLVYHIKIEMGKWL